MEDKIRLDQLKTTELSPKDLAKIHSDLGLIELISRVSKDVGCRVVIGGGYAVDGALGRITRPHGDIDIQIYGTEDASVIHQIIGNVDHDSRYTGMHMTDKGRQLFTHNFLLKGNGMGADIYYVQVKSDPFAEDKEVVKSDGTLSERHSYETQLYTLEGVSFEGVNPTSELADKVYKREYRKDPVKSNHTQDIENLKLLTDPNEVDKRVQKLVLG